MTPDVNVLVAAFRPDHMNHATAYEWLSRARLDCARGTQTLTLVPVVISGFLRLVTNSRVFVDPDRIDEAVGFVDAILETPGSEIRSSADEWPLLRNKLLDQRLEGNMITDAWIASAIEAHAEHLVTFDRDFIKLLPQRNLTLLSVGA
ncbi:MAG: TA system VapC family ribonuclease toxin [Burkholderiaceae bacterium]